MWQESYLIGHEQIDQQHKMLVETLSELLACLRGEETDKVLVCKKTMDFLGSYANTHFAAEEMLQEAIGFPDRDRHRQLHNTYREQVHALGLRLIRQNYDAESSGKLAEFLTQWWIYHISKEDKKMAAYL